MCIWTVIKRKLRDASYCPEKMRRNGLSLPRYRNAIGLESHNASEEARQKR